MMSHFYCIGCKEEGDFEEGVECETCGVATCIDHMGMINTTSANPEEWVCHFCDGEEE